MLEWKISIVLLTDNDLMILRIINGKSKIYFANFKIFSINLTRIKLHRFVCTSKIFCVKDF